MKDLDFDELDRAVNSLIEKTDAPSITPKPITPKTEPTPKAAPVQVSSAASSDGGVKVNNTKKSISIASSPRPVMANPNSIKLPKTLVLSSLDEHRRAAGRFLDVVHPNSTVKTSTPPQAIVIPERPRISRAEILQQKLARESANPTFSIGGRTNIGSFVPVVAPKNKPSIPKSNEPQFSPFLTNTKVEKRPLGSVVETSNPKLELPINPPEQPVAKVVPLPESMPVANVASPKIYAEPQATPDSSPLNFRINLPISQTTVAPKAASVGSTPLPPELQGDILSIESNTILPAEETISSVPPKGVSTPNVSPSIPQQYTEQPSSGEQKNGSIYDTNSYHKPLPRVIKHKSNLTWLIWVGAIMAVGVLAGVAFYFYNM